jgi:hypothetical protein
MTPQEEYQKQLQTEHELINRRLTWLLTSQTILFAALGFMLEKGVLSMQNKLFSIIVACLGLAISVFILIGIIMGVIAKITVWNDYNSCNETKPKVQLGVRTWITFGALIPDVCIPLAFVFAWIMFFLVKFCI